MASMKMVVLGMVVVAALLQSSAAQTTHVVGDSLGWTIPSGGAVAYSNWASNKTFTVGDVLVFNFQNGRHDVAEMTKAAYDSCNTNNSSNPITTGPARITLNSAGEHFYICTYSGHCSAGQKLAIKVSASASPAPQPTAATPSPTPTPTSTPTPAPEPAPSSSAQTYTVGDSTGWTIPSGGSAAYQNWASNKTFRVGDTLVFNFQNGQHDVAEVTKAEYDSCNASSSTNPINSGPARMTLNSSGEHFYICTFTGHCSAGQKLAINVTGTSTSPSPSPTSPPPSTATPPSPSAPTPKAPSPSGTPTPPGTPSPAGSLTPPTASSPSDTTAPPPPNGAPSSLAAAALPVTLLSVALALLH